MTTGDCTLHFSAEIARRHGLEQAIALSVIQQFKRYRKARKGWTQIAHEDFQACLPFWSLEIIQTALNQLSVQGLIEIHQAGSALEPNFYYREKVQRDPSGLPIVNSPQQIGSATQSGSQAHSIHSRSTHSNSTQTGSGNPNTTPGQAQNFSRSGPLPPNWQPDPHLIQQLTRLGIPTDFINDAVMEFVTYWRESGKSAISWGAKFQERVRKLWMEHETKVANNRIPSPITKEWQPSQDALDILMRDGIDGDFIKDSLAEFLLYWMERGSAEVTWNNKFVSHIRHQWQKFCSTIEHSTNPTRIPKNWTPSSECYDIARLAQIDQEFAKDQVKPFVLYWSDSNQTSTSWNTKFVQHLKWSWAKRHQLENIGQSVKHEKASGNHQSGHTANQSFIERHQDTSWADDL